MQRLGARGDAAVTGETAMIDRRTILGASAAMAVTGAAAGVARATPLQRTTLQWPTREHFKLWPGGAPGAPATLPVPKRDGPEDGRELWMRGVAEPTVSVYRPAKPNGIGVLSIPGGGYSFVSVENEGAGVARVLNPLGYTVFVLTYRLPGEGWSQRADVPLQDAQRAMRLIRARAGSLGIDPAKLGILGFSAGGHLAASLTVGHADPVYTAVDAADRGDARPAFSGLVYPVTALTYDDKLNGSGRNLVGDVADPAILARYDTVARVTAQTPPIFLLHAADDGLVPLEMGLSMLTAARAAKVPVEGHFYEKGGHGFGMAADPAHPAHGWGALFATWVARHMAT
ncbi:alpha/beta hydrolase [Sphingomonas qomolangmaensis]|uniref:Alpha/beta hydrolase n=1 Tax=Sphingomonas qomolangmaensis TaxID=2918765 RepID=A0ABY5L9Y4_9SPHN|nr:alpha/beta hydrolase [Sphingomonas qomolangmaensis]UUL83242.1 alpha/beta hydrolase [Sphingomonas qomolangmaensis]